MAKQAAPMIENYSAKLHDMLEWLAQFGADEQGGVTRLLYTPAWLEAQQSLFTYMEAQGLEPFYDQVGNLSGRLVGQQVEQLPIVTGSHIDTVVFGGKYDGALGVVAGVLALSYLKETYGQPLRTIEVISLAEEEGSRFPLTYWGSGNITGSYQADQVPMVQDREGISLEQAMKQAGFGADSNYSTCKREFAAYIELHIEQGFVLERTDHQIGVVTGIVGQRRIEVKVLGESNHAGTTPMQWRRDTLAGAALMISHVKRSALEWGDPLVATVGSLHVSPNVPNVIAGETTFTLDIRHLDHRILNDYTDALYEEISAIAQQEGLTLSWKEHLRAEPVPMHQAMIDDLQHVCDQAGISSMLLPSGAGHDAQIFGVECPSAMIFVPSREGISHNPLEYTAEADIVQGFKVLTELLYQYAYRGEDHEAL